MRHLVLVALLSILANIPTCAQEPCKYGSENPFDAMAKDLSQAKSCSAAAAKMRDCSWGSSADTQLAPIAIQKRVNGFKLHVRKLKALGLTRSLEVGYRLSPRGQAYLGVTHASGMP